MNDIARKIDGLRQSWLEQSAISENFALMGLADTNMNHVADALADMSRMAVEINGETPESMTLTHRSCEEMIQVAESYLAEHLKDRDIIHILGFLTLLKQIRLTLAGASAQHIRKSATRRPRRMKAA